MGSSASKASRSVGSAARKYPARTPSLSGGTSNASPQPPPAPHTQAGPTVRPQPRASTSRDDTINLDASDPDFARSLRSIGPVQPNPTLSQTSAFPHTRSAAPDPRTNPAITVLEARSRLQDEAELEFQRAGRRGNEGRQFLDVFTIRQILTQRDEHRKSAAEIERGLGLKSGVVDRLGANGMVELTQNSGRATEGVDFV